MLFTSPGTIIINVSNQVQILFPLVGAILALVYVTLNRTALFVICTVPGLVIIR